MAGIRVSYLPDECTEKDIKIHFNKPENGGGPIQAIYYPLFYNDAVVIFEEPLTTQTVTAHEHTLLNQDIAVDPLYEPQVFLEMEAKLDPSVAAFIQATENVKDEMQYHKNVEFCYDQNNTIVGVRGNWYLLEWVWAYIERVTRSQRQYRPVTERRTQTQVRPASPGEVSDSMISVPFASQSMTSNHHRLPDRVNHERDSAQAGGRRNDTELKEQLDSNIDSDLDNPVGTEGRRRKCLEGDADDDRNDDDTIDKLAGLTLSRNDKNVQEITIHNDKPDDLRSLEFQYGPLRINVYNGFITMAESDAIVNAAMGSMVNAGGVAYAIARAAGPDMQRQCDEYVTRRGNLPTTGVMHTCAGGDISPSVKYVIHTVGPIYSSRNESECACQLTKTFLNCLTYGADFLKIQSITLPVISSGIFGCPLEMCVRSFFNAVLLFVSSRTSDVVCLKEVNLVNNNCDNTAMTVLQLRHLISQETQGLVQEALAQIQQFEEIPLAQFDAKSKAKNDVTKSAATTAQSLETTKATKQGASRVQKESKSSETTPYPTSSKSPAAGTTTKPSKTERMSSAEKNSSSAGTKEGARSSASMDRNVAGASPSSGKGRTNTSDTSKSRKTGPPTTSYLYESEKSGSASKCVTTGRPLPGHPVVSKQVPSKKY